MQLCDVDHWVRSAFEERYVRTENQRAMETSKSNTRATIGRSADEGRTLPLIA